MRSFAEKPKTIQQTASATTRHSRAHIGQSREVNSIRNVPRTIGNQATERLLEVNTSDGKENTTTAGINHDFSRIPIHPRGRISVLPLQMKMRKAEGKPGSGAEKLIDGGTPSVAGGAGHFIGHQRCHSSISVTVK